MARQALTPIWDQLGLCVGSNINNGGTQTDDGIQEDADYHDLVGLQHVRMPMMSYYWEIEVGGYGFNQAERLRRMADIYVAKGISVRQIIQLGTYDKSQTTRNAAFLDYLSTWAEWMEAHGISSLQLTNEQELHLGAGTSYADCYTWQQSLVPVARSAGFTGEVTVSVTQDNDSQWAANGVGNFDTIGLDIYRPKSTFRSYVAGRKAIYGDLLHLSEWSVTNSGNEWDFNKQDPLYIEDWIIHHLNVLKELLPNHPHYYYCWKNANDGPIDALAACKLYSGELRKFWYPLIGQKSPITF